MPEISTAGSMKWKLAPPSELFSAHSLPRYLWRVKPGSMSKETLAPTPLCLGEKCELAAAVVAEMCKARPTPCCRQWPSAYLTLRGVTRPALLKASRKVSFVLRQWLGVKSGSIFQENITEGVNPLVGL